jgi:hypothetical protein
MIVMVNLPKLEFQGSREVLAEKVSKKIRLNKISRKTNLNLNRIFTQMKIIVKIKD